MDICGEDVYRVVCEPLVRGTFRPYAGEISAVWFWNKVILRGGSRGKGGAEILAYCRSGFAAPAQRLSEQIRNHGGTITTEAAATAIRGEDGAVVGVETRRGFVRADRVLARLALPIIADLVKPHVSADDDAKRRRIEYLANICLVLELDRGLSDLY